MYFIHVISIVKLFVICQIKSFADVEKFNVVFEGLFFDIEMVKRQLGVTCISPNESLVSSEQDKIRSQLVAQFMPFFRLIPRILTFRNKKYRILMFRDKTESHSTVLQQNMLKM